MIVVCKYIWRILSSEGEELFKLMDNVGTRTSGYKLAMDKNRLEIRRFLTIRGTRYRISLLVRVVGGKQPSKF